VITARHGCPPARHSLCTGPPQPVGWGWAPAEVAHSFEDTAQDLPDSAWQTVTRRFTDGHKEAWWAVELTLFGYGPQQPERAIVATTC
jgi:hypothetical protein